MKKILITGAGGYIGSVAAYLFLSRGYEVVGIDNYITGYRQPLAILQQKFGDRQFRFYEGDLHRNLPGVFKKEPRIEAVVHYAASCLVDESMKNPHKYFHNNVVGTLTLLEEMTKQHIHSLVFSSTAAVYGEPTHIPLLETDETNPINPYGESKRTSEKIIEWYGKLKGLHYVILRYFNVCGGSNDGLIGDSKKPSTLLIQNAVRGALGIAPFYLTCPVVATPDKTPIRDYVDVVDLNEAHFAALDYLSKKGRNEVINIGSGTGNSVLEIVSMVQKATGHVFDVKKTNPRLGDPARLVASIDKAKRTLSWVPKRNLASSVSSLLTWYKSRPHGWEK